MDLVLPVRALESRSLRLSRIPVPTARPGHFMPALAEMPQAVAFVTTSEMLRWVLGTGGEADAGAAGRATPGNADGATGAAACDPHGGSPGPADVPVAVVTSAAADVPVQLIGCCSGSSGAAVAPVPWGGAGGLPARADVVAPACGCPCGAGTPLLMLGSALAEARRAATDSRGLASLLVDGRCGGCKCKLGRWLGFCWWW